ncbi:MAG: hypothetical protein ACLFRG_06685 [Desulfococcaceae bacterium]
MDTRRFTKAVTAYLRSAAALDRSLDAGSDAQADPLEEAVRDILDEGEALLERISVAVNRLVYVGPGPETAASAFRKVKQQQIGLLSALADDIELIRDQVRRSRDLQALFQDQSARLHRAANLLEAIHQRFIHRPTTLLQLSGPDPKIGELNRTFEEINRFEDAQGREMADPGGPEGPVRGALGDYRATVGQTYADLETRRDRIRKQAGERAEGRKLLMALAQKGLSPWRRHRVRVLFAKHQGRSRQFREAIRALRTHDPTETRPRPT